MRILHLDADDPDHPRAAGGVQRTYEIGRRLARRHEVTVLTPGFAGCAPEQQRDGVRYLRLGGRRSGEWPGAARQVAFGLALPRALRRHPHELLVEDFMPPCSTAWTPLYRPRGSALVASVQWFYARRYSERLKLPFHWGETHGLRLYRDFVMLSASMKRQIEQRHPRARCHVIHNGVDDRLFGIAPQPGRGILWLGRADIETKGLDLLLQAYARIPEVEREPLTLAGAVLDPAALQAWVGRTGLAGWVRITGPYDTRQRARLLEQCRFVALPSRHETFGLTLAEANAAAKPVVLWDRAPMHEVASPGCLRVPAFDLDAYAQALRHLLGASADELRLRGLRARAHARRYDWDSAADAQERCYFEALEQQARHRHAAGRSVA